MSIRNKLKEAGRSRSTLSKNKPLLSVTKEIRSLVQTSARSSIEVKDGIKSTTTDCVLNRQRLKHEVTEAFVSLVRRVTVASLCVVNVNNPHTLLILSDLGVLMHCLLLQSFPSPCTRLFRLQASQGWKLLNLGKLRMRYTIAWTKTLSEVSPLYF